MGWFKVVACGGLGTRNKQHSQGTQVESLIRYFKLGVPDDDGPFFPLGYSREWSLRKRLSRGGKYTVRDAEAKDLPRRDTAEETCEEIHLTWYIYV